MNTLLFYINISWTCDVISMYIKVGLQLSSQETQGQLARVLFRVILMQHGHYGSFFRFFHFLSNFLLPSSTLLLKVMSHKLRYWKRSQEKSIHGVHILFLQNLNKLRISGLWQKFHQTTPMNIFQVSILTQGGWPLLTSFILQLYTLDYMYD